MLASQVIYESDALGRTTEHQFDNLGREIATITNDPDGAGPLESAVFCRSFDAASRVIDTLSPKNQSVQFRDIRGTPSHAGGVAGELYSVKIWSLLLFGERPAIKQAPAYRV